MHSSAKRGLVMHVVCLSVCLSVGNVDLTGWNTSKVISRPINLGPLPGVTPVWAIWCDGNTPIMGVLGVTQPDKKTCDISETVRDRTKLTITD